MNNLKTMSWQEVLGYEDDFPEHKERAKKFIRLLLGYVPPIDGTYFTQEQKIRKAIERYNVEKYSAEKHFDELYAIATEMRNHDMKRDDFCRLEYNERDIEAYTTYNLVPYSQIARDRLSHFLGYYPELRYSLDAEIFLRDCLADDKFYPQEEITAYDMRSITIVKYREILLNEGATTADKSSLFGFEWAKENVLEKID